MKTTLAIATGIMTLVGTALTVMPAAGDDSTPGQAVKKQTLCPIMGGAVNTNVYADANGKRVYFCCGGCPATFQKDPAKYIKKMEAEGITLDRTPPAAPAR